MLAHSLRELFRRSRAAFLVDVEPVRRIADRYHLGAKFVQHCGRDVVGGTVRAIHDDAQAIQARAERNGALAELDITTGGIGDAVGPAEFGGTHRRDLPIEVFFDFQFGLIP